MKIAYVECVVPMILESESFIRSRESDLCLDLEPVDPELVCGGTRLD